MMDWCGVLLPRHRPADGRLSPGCLRPTDRPLEPAPSGLQSRAVINYKPHSERGLSLGHQRARTPPWAKAGQLRLQLEAALEAARATRPSAKRKSPVVLPTGTRRIPNQTKRRSLAAAPPIAQLVRTPGAAGAVVSPKDGRRRLHRSGRGPA